MKSIPVSFVCLLLFLCSAWDGLRAQGLVSPEYLADAVVLDSRVKAAAGPAGAQVEIEAVAVVGSA
jgi:hypothetical protein